MGYVRVQLTFPRKLVVSPPNPESRAKNHVELNLFRSMRLRTAVRRQYLDHLLTLLMTWEKTK